MSLKPRNVLFYPQIHLQQQNLLQYFYTKTTNG